MIYFKKTDYFYCKLDPSTFTFWEVLSGSDQAKVTKITNEELYNEMLQRIETYAFTIVTFEEFSSFFNYVTTRINSEY